MATLNSYELKGKKLSFANWISNLSPTDTPFTSMTGKEQTKNTLFQWQTDRLSAASKDNAQKEGEVAIAGAHVATVEHDNITQILRKVVSVSDTADALDNYGRNKELEYQMEKAGKEIKRDLELILLSDQARVDGDATAARKTACFQSLVAAKDTADGDTGAIVHKHTGVANSITEDQLFDMTYNLYIAGSEANIIMFHPKHASFFAALMETPAAGSNRLKMFDGLDTKYNKFVASIVDPLGQEFRLIPNRFMPEDSVYFLNPKDWTQMVLRAPERTKLAKTGSSEKYMIEMEVGLRHRNPYASGVLKLKA